ncbi:MAG: hypothetical protein A2206_01095 [Candidatus Magasanikbacteria bacterium RIFOXYA1_FULL_40_8]|uniref:Peptidase C39-like domain-containing protein n=1 Tax=Candidatus Magasanikbacteria bacterium RIFOXYA1_FULL_40_8 TaxID=1798694 RepID=A0A1F6NSX2_9BACT|nr:MAG: hypothetical protein A2206_01095 [Candidatus Magasanikbacteria bacterium RIFOXYA1_FULL_40_8]
MYFRYVILFFLFSLSFANPAFSKSLNVPFTVQAPDANWNQPWQDACEETVIAMVDYFYSKNTFTTGKAKEAILQMIKIKEKYLGTSLDENAETIALLINNFLTWEAYIRINPTLEDIKKEIDNNRPVIMPAHGKYLYNPYFQNGGPEYHSLVISGYDDEKQEFITQEPGTRHGLDFRYSYGNIMNAMHDFLPGGQTKFGDKTAIFTSPNITSSANDDADGDGLVKIKEIELKTLLWSYDSDNDGYRDGQEIEAGYSPISANALLGTLIKTPDSPMVYLFFNNTIRHILNEAVFISHGWKWFNIFTVPGNFIENLETGAEISQ